MKKFLSRAWIALLLFLYMVFLPFPQSVAHAEDTPSSGDYACILSDNTYFYSAADDRRGLFVLPKTYYVRLLEYGTEYCKVEYQRDEGQAKRLVGYAKTDALTFVDYVPVRPYLYYVFTVTYTMGDVPESKSPFLNEYTVSCAYYGDYKIGSETYCYVLRGEEFGYVIKPTTISYGENDEYADYLASLTPKEPIETPPSSQGESNPVQIAILIAVCILVPILAALIMKPPRRPPYETEE